MQNQTNRSYAASQRKCQTLFVFVWDWQASKRMPENIMKFYSFDGCYGWEEAVRIMANFYNIPFEDILISVETI